MSKGKIFPALPVLGKGVYKYIFALGRLSYLACSFLLCPFELISTNKNEFSSFPFWLCTCRATWYASRFPRRDANRSYELGVLVFLSTSINRDERLIKPVLEVRIEDVVLHRVLLIFQVSRKKSYRKQSSSQGKMDFETQTRACKACYGPIRFSRGAPKWILLPIQGQETFFDGIPGPFIFYFKITS